MSAVRAPWLTACALAVTACSSAGPPPPQRAGSGASTLVAPVAAPSLVAGAPAPDAPAAAVAPVEIPDWKAPDPSSAVELCKSVDKAQAAASRKDAALPAGALNISIAPLSCIPARRGAWGLVQTITRYERDELNAIMDPACGPPDGNPCVYDALLSLVPTFVSAGGDVRTGKAIQAQTFADKGPSDRHAGAFDLDGDGVDELLFADGPSAIFSYKDGKVSPYAAASGLAFNRLVDIDRDGRPDLLLHNPYVAGKSVLGCGRRGGHPILDFMVDVHVVARSLPDGTFSTGDAAAQAITKAECPAKPDPIVVKDAIGMFDNRKIRENVACARLWGVPPTAVIDALDASCKWPADDGCDALFDVRDGIATPVCAGRDELAAWAKAAPPITLH